MDTCSPGIIGYNVECFYIAFWRKGEYCRATKRDNALDRGCGRYKTGHQSHKHLSFRKEKPMKIFIVIALLLVAGCLPASQQEVQTLTDMVNQIVPAVREAVSTSSAETRDRVEIVLGQVETINEAVATAEDPVDALEKGWDATVGWNPYYGYGVLGLGILRLFQKKRESDNALEEVVIGVEDSKKNGGKLREAFNSTESLITRRKVAKIIYGT